MAMGVPGYDCIVLQSGKCVYRHCGGFTDPERTVPVDGTERYNIYSASKLLTCTAAMQLWEQGAFSLDEELSRYMPEFSEMTVRTEDGGVKRAENPIRIGNLFDMTAGFTYDTETPPLMQLRKDTDGKCPTREAMKYLAMDPLAFEPGDHWNYSLCHDVLAALVEVISGQRFSQYVKENIFDRLGMDRSTFLLPADELDSIAHQYKYYEETGTLSEISKEIQKYKLGTEYESGGAGAISTVDDYTLFLEALREGETLLKRDTIQLMATNRLSSYQSRTYWFDQHYGYGLGMRCPIPGGNHTDYGWGGAAGAYLIIDPVNDFTVYYSQHVLTSPNRNLRGRMYSVIRRGLER